MSIKGRYKMRIDELNYAIVTAYGIQFGEFDKKLRTPDNLADFDETRTYPFTEYDELRTGPNFEIDELKIAPKQEIITQQPVILSTEQKKQLKDDILEYLIFAYTDGIDAVNEMLTSNVEPTLDGIWLSINKSTAGETLTERLDRHINAGDVPAIVKTADTEFHRIFNDGIEDGGKEAGAVYKRWETMEDDKVRDAHWELQGVTVPFNEKFYIDGAEADKPGGFGVPELDINCRCYLELTK